MGEQTRILVAVDQTQEWGRQIYHGAQLRGHLGRNWQVSKHQNRPWSGLLEHLRESHYDGAILHLAVDYLDDEFAALDIPIVNTSNTSASRRFPAVLNDDEEAGRLAGVHLQQCGYRTVHFLPSGSIYSDERAQGLSSVFPGLKIHAPHIDTALEDAVRDADGSDAWVCADDSLARQFIGWAADRDLVFPAHGGVVGFNNEEARFTGGPLSITSVVLAYERVGEAAVDLLAENLEKGKSCSCPIVVRIPPSGVEVRASTSPEGLHSRVVREAVKRIQNSQGDTTVPDILHHLTCTRRALELAFKKELKTTPHQYILKARADRAKRLLMESDRSVTEIAIDCGFSGPTQIGAVFKRIFGVSPSQVRRMERGA